MNTFIVDLIWANISASLVFAVILLIKRALGSRMSARFQYAIWFLLIIRLLIPVNIKIGYSFLIFSSIS